MNPKLAQQYFQRADEFVRAGNPEEALPLLAMLDEAFPNTKNVLFARAKTLAALGQEEEAITLCDRILTDFEAPRAEALKSALLAGDYAATRHKKRHDLKFGRKTRTAVRVAVLLLALALVGGAATYAFRTAQIETAVAAPSQTEFAALEDARRQAKLDEALAPVDTSFVVHPREQWELTATRGVPRWKPGIYRQVPCLNAPERTIDAFIPMAYQEQPKAKFPAVIIQMPGGTPGFIQLLDWADSRGVILVGINSSSNGTFENNHIAQDRALETVAETMRVDQRLGFAIGMSGGGRSSWRMVRRYPNNFRGIVVMGISGYHDGEIAQHVRVAFIHGDDEPNNWSIARSIRRLQQRGQAFRDKVVPGEHVMGPPIERIQMLEWMVGETRREFGLPHPETPLPSLVHTDPAQGFH